MKKTNFAIAAVVAAFASNALAQSSNDQIVADLTSQGFNSIEIKNGIGQTKVEALRDGQKIEVVYDQATGDILKQEIEMAESDDFVFDGVRIRQENKIFVDGPEDDDDDSDDDESDDSDSDDSGDDSSGDDDDNSGSGNSDDDDEDDDDDDDDDDD